MKDVLPKTRTLYFNNAANLVKATQVLTSTGVNVSNNDTASATVEDNLAVKVSLR